MTALRSHQRHGYKGNRRNTWIICSLGVDVVLQPQNIDNLNLGRQLWP